MINSKELTCFKSYDIRGKIGEELNQDIAYRIGRHSTTIFRYKYFSFSFDARATSLELARALAQGVCDAGSDVLDLGLAGTEEMYAAVSEFGADAGVEVTSHNPIDYNGMKIVKRQSKP